MKYKILHLTKTYIKAIFVKILYVVFGSMVGALTLFIVLLNNRPDLHPWQTIYLDEEFTVEKQADIVSFGDYLALEKKLFKQLKTGIYSESSTSTRNKLNRFESGSLSDPVSYVKNWNRSFIMKPEQPRGGVLLLHGLSDSPYSIRSLAQSLYQQGYFVLGLRMPGHGTAPSGLVDVTWQDMAAAVKIAANHISSQLDAQQPMVILGYSMGAALAVNYSLDAIKDKNLRPADALVLISPAIGVSAVAALAVWQSRLSSIPGLQKLAWNSIGPEYDPYKYNSFAINAGDQMYRLTQAIGNKLSILRVETGTAAFPRTMAVNSLVDATVSMQDVVTHLFDKLDNKGNELVVFDINRHENLTMFMKDDPIEEYRALLKRSQLNYDLTFYTNESEDSDSVITHRWLKSNGDRSIEKTGLVWPTHVYSLSHVALPFPPTDSLYGSAPEDDEGLHIGQLEIKGERGIFSISASDMLRLRYNPFYSTMQQQIIDFLEKSPAN